MNGKMHNNTKDGHTYIIAEVGQNHNGSFQKACNLIDIAAVMVGHYGNEFQADAVKFTKREMTEELTAEAYNMPYTGSNSYGKTYGEHREALELTYEQHAELFLYAKKKGLDFVETICSPGALRLLKYFRPDFIKVASRDIDNIPLLEAIAEEGAKEDIPVIISTGMATLDEIITAVTILEKLEVTILQCISQYPARYENLNLNCMTLMQAMFNDCVIGFSDHTTGVLAPSIAVALGAKVIEKHITYDRNAKGTDHAGSMDLGGFERVVRDVRNTELAKGGFFKEKCPGTMEAEKKLKRKICVNRDMKKGEIVQESDLIMLSGPGEGLPPSMISAVVGQVLEKDKKKYEIL